MSEIDELQQNESMSSSQSYESDLIVNRFKFMTSALIPSQETVTYVEKLEPVSSDPRVSFKRILISIFVLGLTGIGLAKFISADLGKVPYVIVPTIIFALCILILTVLYMLPERDFSSKLGVSLNLLVSKFVELGRKKSQFKLTSPKYKIDNNGMITFDNGKVGFLFKIVGQLNNTTLTAYVEQLSEIRKGYLIEREATVEEMMITKIETLDYKDNLTHLKETYQALDDNWSKAYFAQQYNFINSQMANKEIGFKQYLLITDLTEERLKQATRVLLNSAGEGLYEEITQLADKDLIKSVVYSPLLVNLIREPEEELDDESEDELEESVDA